VLPAKQAARYNQRQAAPRVNIFTALKPPACFIISGSTSAFLRQIAALIFISV